MNNTRLVPNAIKEKMESIERHFKILIKERIDGAKDQN